MNHLPHYLELQVPENGTMQDELLMALVKSVEDQNAILDDAIHSELKRIADAQASIAESLDAIVRHFVVGY